MLSLATIYCLLGKLCSSLFGEISFGKSCHAYLVGGKMVHFYYLEAQEDVPNHVLFLNYSYMLGKTDTK